MSPTPTLTMLAGYALLTLALVVSYVGFRVALVLTFKAPANSWPRIGAQHPDPAWVTRAQHAHLNCVENLPVLGAVVLIACISQKLDLLDPLAYAFLAMRLGQSVVHLIGTSPALVFIRANFFLAQIGILVWWLYLLVR